MPYSEEKVILDYERSFCYRIQPFVRALGAAEVYQCDRMGNEVALPHYWRLRESKDHEKRTEITFRGIGYTDGHRDYGEATVYEEPSEDGGEREHIVAPPEGLQRKVTREVKTREEVSTDYRGAVSFSITNTDKVSAKAGVEGVAEASAEHETTMTLKTDFGWASGQKCSMERIVRGETSFSIPGGQTRVLTIDVNRIKEVRPFTDAAYLDYEIDIDLYDWAGNYSSYVAGRGRHDNVIHCANVQDLLWLIEGQRPVEYPGMANFLSTCDEDAREFYHWLLDEENRRVDIGGDRTRYYANGLDIAVREIA